MLEVWGVIEGGCSIYSELLHFSIRHVGMWDSCMVEAQLNI